MPRLTVLKETEIVQTPRVVQIGGMFDIPPAEKSSVQWDIDLPLDAQKWNIGLIVGASGCGKTTIARELFPDKMVSGFEWSREKSVIDNFPEDLPIKELSGYLTSVGFGSVPSWLRPFHVLSNGEQFRVTLARALAETRELVVMDEFTSVVDRQVAQIASHCVQKTVRRADRQFVAVSCHYDIIDWLQPDWIYQPEGNQFTRRSLQRRPEITVDIHPIDRSAWRIFKAHHYMSAELAKAAQCFGAFIGDQCVAFTSYIHFAHPRRKNIKMGHRLVVLPDYQGLGIGGRLDEWLGQHLFEQGYSYHNVVAHPAMVAYYSKSPRWKHIRTGRMSGGSKSSTASLRTHQQRLSMQRVSSTFVYMPPAPEKAS